MLIFLAPLSFINNKTTSCPALFPNLSTWGGAAFQPLKGGEIVPSGTAQFE